MPNTPTAENRKHITDQLWYPSFREGALYLVSYDDGSIIAKLCRPDGGSDSLLAGYICGLQAKEIKKGA